MKQRIILNPVVDSHRNDVQYVITSWIKGNIMGFNAGIHAKLNRMYYPRTVCQGSHGPLNSMMFPIKIVKFQFANCYSLPEVINDQEWLFSHSLTMTLPFHHHKNSSHSQGQPLECSLAQASNDSIEAFCMNCCFFMFVQCLKILPPYCTTFMVSSPTLHPAPTSCWFSRDLFWSHPN